MLKGKGDSCSVKERRVFERVVVRLPVKLSQEDFCADVYLRDISAGGAKLITKRRLLPEDNVNLWVQVPDDKGPLHLNGKVVWVKEVGLDVWDAGIRFSQIRLMDLHRVFSI